MFYWYAKQSIKFFATLSSDLSHIKIDIFMFDNTPYTYKETCFYKINKKKNAVKRPLAEVKKFFI